MGLAGFEGARFGEDGDGFVDKDEAGGDEVFGPPA